MKKFALLSLLFLSFFACREDIDIAGDGTVTTVDPPIVIEDYDPVSQIVTGSLTGLVYDEAKNPVADAKVTLRGTVYTTDEDGLFVATDVQLDREGTFFTVEKAGYFKGSRRFYPQANALNYARVELLDLTTIGNFDSADEAVITSTEGISLSFPANAIKTADGSLHSGNVNVAARWIDPTADNINEIMPGNLFGLNRGLEEVSMASYGMMAVELFADDGSALNIADGQKAELSFPVPDELMGSAPAEIPLWSFEDETYGIWVEEGKATLQGNKYVGDVSHFSFWNCDAPFPLIYVTGTLVTDNGVPIANAWVKVQIAGSAICSGGQTDGNGTFAGKMPKDQELIISIGYNGDCIYESISVGPFSVDTDLGELNMNDAGNAFEVSGSVVDCVGNPITQGWVEINIGNQSSYIYLTGDNTFEVGLLNCDNATDFTIVASDVINFEESDVQTYTVDPIVDAGEIAACGNVISEYFSLTVDGETVIYVEAFVSTQGNSLNLNVIDSLNSTGQDGSFSLYMSDGAEGTYVIDDISWMQIATAPPTWTNSYYLACEGGYCTTSSFELIITLNEGSGGNLEGTLNGVATFTDEVGTAIPDIPFSADFKLPIQ